MNPALPKTTAALLLLLVAAAAGGASAGAGLAPLPARGTAVQVDVVRTALPADVAVGDVMSVLVPPANLNSSAPLNGGAFMVYNEGDWWNVACLIHIIYDDDLVQVGEVAMELEYRRTPSGVQDAVVFSGGSSVRLRHDNLTFYSDTEVRTEYDPSGANEVIGGAFAPLTRQNDDLQPRAHAFVVNGAFDRYLRVFPRQKIRKLVRVVPDLNCSYVGHGDYVDVLPSGTLSLLGADDSDHTFYVRYSIELPLCRGVVVEEGFCTPHDDGTVDFRSYGPFLSAHQEMVARESAYLTNPMLVAPRVVRMTVPSKESREVTVTVRVGCENSDILGVMIDSLVGATTFGGLDVVGRVAKAANPSGHRGGATTVVVVVLLVLALIAAAVGMLVWTRAKEARAAEASTGVSLVDDNGSGASGDGGSYAPL